MIAWLLFFPWTEMCFHPVLRYVVFGIAVDPAFLG